MATSNLVSGSVGGMEDNRKVRADSEAFEAFVSEAASDLLRSAFVLTGD